MSVMMGGVKEKAPDQLAPSPKGRSVTDGRTGPLAGCPPLQAWGRSRVRGGGTQHCGTNSLLVGDGWPPQQALSTPSYRPSRGLPHGPGQSQDGPGHSPFCRNAGSSSRGSSRGRLITLLQGDDKTSTDLKARGEALGGTTSGKSRLQERNHQAPSEGRGRVGIFPNSAAPE